MSQNQPVCQRILLTNDDGIDAPGLAVLEKIAAGLAHEVWVVAPERDQSGTSHSISLHQPLRVTPRGERRFAVSGTPGDCVAMAVSHLMAGQRPDLLLSGINRGANIGTETMFSGTVGAAMTGMLMGIRSFALSQAYLRREEVPWQTAAAVAPQTIRTLLTAHSDNLMCLYINFPAVSPDAIKPLTVTRQGRGYLNGIDIRAATDPRGQGYYWLTLSRARTADEQGTEAALLREGHISVTPLGFERTHADISLFSQALDSGLPS